MSGGKTISTTQTKIGALRIQNSSQGFPVPIVFGTTRITSNLLWFGDFTAIPSTTSQKQGKGGGTTTTNTTYSYTCSTIFGLCEGPVVSSSFLGTVWADKKVTTPTALNLIQFQGSYTQSPWTYLTTNHSNQALSYRGDCYVAAAAFDLGTNNGLPNLSFEVNGLLGAGDQNPADIITQMLTNDKFGVGWPAAQLGDISNFKAYCAAAGFLVSPAYVSQTPMSQLMTELLQVGNAGLIWSDGLLKIIPYADTTVGSYVPNLTIQYSLGYDDFIASHGTDPVQVDRKRQADAYNAVKVETLDRSNQYNTYIAEAKDQLAIDTYGLRPMSQVSAHMICDNTIARSVAQTILQRELYVRNIYTFTIGWRYGRLEPMDIVTLTDAALGLVAQPVRIISIEEDESGQLLMQAEELNIGVSTPGSYAAQTSNGATPANNSPPGNATVPVMFQPPIALSGQPQIWIGAAGGVNWGGAQIWASNDNATYTNVGTLTGPARIGTLTANYPLAADPDTADTLAVNLSTSNGVLVSASNAVADQLGTLSYVGGANAAAFELVAYSTAVLTSPGNYSLGNYVRRAQAGSTASLHLTGANFMRLDAAVAAINVAAASFGTTIFVKLLSYNTVGGAVQALSDVSAYSFNVVAQVVASGSGNAFYADRTSTTAADPGAGKMRFNNASQAAATAVYFDNLTARGANVAAIFSAVGSVGFLDLRDSADANKWATYSITGANVGTFATFNVTYKAGGAEFPNGDTIVATFSPSLPTGVTSVGLTAPPLFNVSNSPVTGTGNLALTFNLTGTSNGQVPTVSNGSVVWANSTGGNGGAGGIGSVGLSLPPIFAVANSPLVANGTLTATLANQVAATFWAGPTTGANGAPTFRAIALTDVPTAGAANGMQLAYANGVVAWAYGNASGGNGGTGGVGSVGLSLPPIFTVANSPLVANGTLTATLANQATNTVFAGPISGANGAPAFRALVAADVPFTLSNPMTAAGDIIIGGANGVATRVAAGTNNYVLTMVGNVPTWAAAASGNGGGGSGTTKVTTSNISLGNQTAGQTAFTYTNVPSIAARGFVWDFNVSSNTTSLFDVVVRGAGADTGTLRLAANGVNSLNYRYTVPFYYENDAAAQTFCIGIRNRGNLSAAFTLNFLGVEKTA